MKFTSTTTAVLALVAALAATSLASSIPRSASWRHSKSTGLSTDVASTSENILQQGRQQQRIDYVLIEKIGKCILLKMAEADKITLEKMIVTVTPAEIKRLALEHAMKLENAVILLPCAQGSPSCNAADVGKCYDRFHPKVTSHSSIVSEDDRKEYEDSCKNIRPHIVSCTAEHTPAGRADLHHAIRKTVQPHFFEEYMEFLEALRVCVKSKVPEETYAALETLVLEIITEAKFFQMMNEHAEANEEVVRPCLNGQEECNHDALWEVVVSFREKVLDNVDPGSVEEYEKHIETCFWAALECL